MCETCGRAVHFILTNVSQSCNRAATELQQSCNNNLTNVSHSSTKLRSSIESSYYYMCSRTTLHYITHTEFALAQTQSWKLCASSRLLSHVSRASANSLLETELELGQRGQVPRQPKLPRELPSPPHTDRKCLPCWQRLL
jgi:hypothetical protein